MRCQTLVLVAWLYLPAICLADVGLGIGDGAPPNTADPQGKPESGVSDLKKDLRSWTGQLKPGSKLSETVDLAPVVDIRFDLEWPDNAEPTATSLVFDLGTNDTVTAEISREAEASDVVTRVTLTTNAGLFLVKTKTTMADVTIASAPRNGTWTIRYRYGMVTIEDPNGVIVAAFSGSPAGNAMTVNPVDVCGFFVRQSRGTLRIANADYVGRKAKSLTSSGNVGAAMQAAADGARMKQLFHAGQYQSSLETAKRIEKSATRIYFAEAPEVASSIAHQGLCRYFLGDFEAAEECYRDALRRCRKSLRTNHPHTLLIMNQLAMCRQQRGEIVTAAEILQECDSTLRLIDVADHPLVVGIRNNLAACLRAQGKPLEAEELFAECLALLQKSKGREVELAMTRSNLAICGWERILRYGSSEPVKEAQFLSEQLRESVRLLEGIKASKARNPLGDIALAVVPTTDRGEELAMARANLAALELSRGKFDDVDELLAKAQTKGSTQALVENCAGFKDILTGKFAAARSHFEAAARVLSDRFGDDYPDTLIARTNLGLACLMEGDPARAEDVWTAAARRIDRARLLVAATGWERAPFVASQSPRVLLAVLHVQAQQPLEAWTEWEAGLGRGLADDLLTADLESRKASDARNATLARLSAIDKVLRSGPPGAQSRAQLLAERDELLTKLSSSGTTGKFAGEPVPLQELQSLIPADTALVGWVDIKFSPMTGTKLDQSWAVIVRQSGPPEWVRLEGTDDSSRMALRRNLKDNKSRMEELQAGIDAVRRSHWLPVLAHLGADVRRLIVLTSPGLEGIPLEWMVGNKISIAYAPSATVYAELRRRVLAPRSGPESLLAIGSPQFGPNSETQALECSRLEIEAIAKLFPEGMVEKRVDSFANVEFLQHAADSGKLASFGFIHFATHSTPQRGPFQSALLLSKDTAPAQNGEESLRSRTAPQDRLLASDVLDTWRLDAVCTTLSACETGISTDYLRGEGYLGLPYAFLAKGSRNVVVTRWPVDDEATMLLMARFYENVLGRFSGSRSAGGTTFETGKRLPIGSALAESQQWLRDLGTDEYQKHPLIKQEGSEGHGSDKLTVAKRSIAQNKTRGVGGTVPRATEDRPFAHPRFWAGFMVMGTGD